MIPGKMIIVPIGVILMFGFETEIFILFESQNAFIYRKIAIWINQFFRARARLGHEPMFSNAFCD
jgi:hypothetical protein